jgi:hypothetical protein
MKLFIASMITARDSKGGQSSVNTQGEGSLQTGLHEGFGLEEQKFPKLREVKIKEDIFICPQVGICLRNNSFDLRITN